MLIRMGFSFQLLPSDFERHFFACAAGCSRLVWNLALNLQKERLDQQLYTLSFEELCDVLKLWKDERPFLSEVHSQPLQLKDRRNDFLHKLSDQLSKNHAVIVLEKLRVKNMTGSARGTIENPGKNVAQKAGLNRAIMRQGWGEFARQVKYKCEWRGGLFRQVAPEYTSQTCSECDFLHADNRKTQALFVCLACGYTDNADRNAAKNIAKAWEREKNNPPQEAPKKKKKRTAGQAGIACCEPVRLKAQKRPKALQAK